MTDFRLSPSGAVIGVVATTSDEVENVSDVTGETLTAALNEIANPTTVTLYDDFVTGGSYSTTALASNSAHIGRLNWLFIRTGTLVSIVRTSNGSGSLRGVYGFTIGSNSANRGGLFLGGIANIDPEHIDSVFWRGYLNSDPTFGSVRRMGLGLDNGANFGGDGIYVEHQATVSGNVQAVAIKGSARTAVNTGIVCPQDTYQIYELRRVATQTWQYYVNGALGATLSGNAIPTVKLQAAVQAQGVINVVSAMGVDTFAMTYRRYAG